MNRLTKTQLAIIVFFIPLVYKLANLPGLLYRECGADGYVALGVITAAEFLQLALVLYVVRLGGLDAIFDRYGRAAYLCFALPLFFVMSVKSVVFVSEIYFYVCDYLFYNVPAYPVVAATLLVVCYVASKGAKAVGRIFELSVWLIPLIVLFGALFGKVRLSWQYLTPVLEDGGAAAVQGIDKYLLYAFDFSPLLFLKVEPKKNIRVAVSAVLCVAAMVFCYILLVASYGRATFLISDAFAHLASFNVVISEIGSLDWPSALLWTTTATGNVALKYSAMGEGFRYMKIRREIGLFILALLVGLLVLFAFGGYSEIMALVVSPVRYVVVGLEIVLPVLLTALLAKKRKEAYAA